MKFTIILVTFAAAVPAYAHFDVRPRVEDSQIITDGSDDGTGEVTQNVRVFGYDFGENTDDPFFTQDPGFNATTGSGLPEGNQLRFNLLGGLDYWDGTGAVAFSPVSTGETLKLEFGAASRTIVGGGAAQTGFNIQTVGSGGALHRHLNAFLNGPDGNTVPAGPGSWGSGDGTQAADGVYLFSMELALDPATGIANSKPIYIVFNNGLSEQLHDSAMNWVQTNLVPDPAGIGVPMLLVGALVQRRRV